MTIGVQLPSSRRVRHTAYPFSTGSMMSSRIASYSFSRANHRASPPSGATSTAKPSASSPVRTDAASRTSSSTTSTRTPESCHGGPDETVTLPADRDGAILGHHDREGTMADDQPRTATAADLPRVVDILVG